MHILNFNLWINTFLAIVYRQPIPTAFHEAIAPIIHQFALHSNYTWFALGFLLMASRLVMIKLGRGFLKGITKLPLRLAMQKNLCIVIEAVFYLGLIGISIYAGLVLVLGLIWFHELGYVSWIAKKFLPGWLLGIILGMAAGIILNRLIARSIEPKLSKKIDAALNTNDDDKYTDIRNVYKVLPKAKEFNPVKYFQEGYMTPGIDINDQPVYIKREQWIKEHIHVMGKTGSGKSVACCSLLAQSMLHGDIVFVIAPKKDEWSPHVLKAMAEQCHLPFYYLDINPGSPPQLQILADIDAEQLEELLDAGIGLAETGRESDVYRLDDRKMARRAALLIEEDPQLTLYGLYRKLCVTEPKLYEQAKFFANGLEEVAGLNCINTREGLNLNQVIQNGGVVYIQGSTKNSRVKKLQKMLLLRIMQLTEDRDMLRQKRQVVIYLDEFKNMISKPALDALSTIRDKAGQVILAHQSLKNLSDVSKDLSSEDVQGTVHDNTGIKLIYRINDPKSAKWAADSTGEKLVQRSSKIINTNNGMGKIINTDKEQIANSKEPLFAANVFQALPNKVGVFFGVGLPRLCFTAPIKVEKSKLVLQEYPPCLDYQDDTEDVTDVGSKKAADTNQDVVVQFSDEKPLEVME